MAPRFIIPLLNLKSISLIDGLIDLYLPVNEIIDITTKTMTGIALTIDPSNIKFPFIDEYVNTSTKINENKLPIVLTKWLIDDF